VLLLLDRGPTGNVTSSLGCCGHVVAAERSQQDGPFFQLCSRSFSLYEGFVRGSPTKRGIDCGYSDNEGFSHSHTTRREEQPPPVSRRNMAAKAGFEVELISRRRPQAGAARYGAGFKRHSLRQRERSVAAAALVNAIRESCVEQRP